MQSSPPPRGVKVVQQIQVLCKDDTETLDLCKNMMKQEYVRDVDYLNNHEADDGDSTMTLLSTNNTSKDLVICLDKRSNIARFINNKHLKSGNTRSEMLHIRLVRSIKQVSPNQATHEDGTSQPTKDQAGTDEEEDGRQGRMKKKMYLLRQRMKMATASPC
ncbi:putative WD repeat-containing proteinC-like [Capsicum annuum]|nr:putative WD repeat-containing proteinC-like [Capsicum annuum]